MKSCSKLIDEKFFAELELNNEELSKFYNALHRAVNGSEPGITDKYAEQDRDILKQVLCELDNVLKTKVSLEMMGLKKVE